MVMDTSTSDPLTPVTELELVDLSGVRDSGMQALILLARSLDWNVHQKVNQPVVLTSRSGVQRRVPTNTSIRMSVFQTHLSAIMTHSTLEATPELMEKIIKTVKPNREQANRLRLAVGMSVQEHRRQSEEPIPAAAERNVPLTQNIEIEWAEPPPEEPKRPLYEVVETKGGTKVTKPVEPKKVAPSKKPQGNQEGGPADHGEHGEVVTKRPFMALVNTHKGRDRWIYDSQTSNERIWTDGYVDYQCMVCPAAYDHPKGVGSHRQVHVKKGEVVALVQADVISASRRRATPEEWEWVKRRPAEVHPRSEKWGKPKDEPETDNQRGYPGQASIEPEIQSPVIEDDRIQRVLEILVPETTEKMKVLYEEVAALHADNDALRAERDKLRSD